MSAANNNLPDKSERSECKNRKVGIPKGSNNEMSVRITV